MLIRKFLFPIGAALASACGWAGAADGGWKLAWSDEFAGTAVDASTWGFESGYVRNQEDQYYTDRSENSRIEAGNLVIEARRDGWSGHAYTSASRTTRGKRSWKYGRFEMRARIDVRPGSWPAWWWLPDAGGWPKGGEIDMMEAYQGKCLFNVMDGTGKWTSPTRTVASLGGDRWAAAYHTWTMEWDSTRIDLYLDGVSMNHYPLEQAEGTGPGGSNPFRHPGYMIVNQAIGGTAGGDPSGTAFPVQFRIEWIRVHAWTAGTAHTLTVTGGAGGGTYVEGAPVSLTAGPAPAGQVFDRWVVAAGSADLADPGAEDTRLSMPAGDAAVTATYKKGTGLRLPRARARMLTIGGAAVFGTGWPAAFPVFDPVGRALPPRVASSGGGPSPAAGIYLLP